MTDQVPGWRKRYGLTRRELIMWALIVGIPTLLVVGGIVGVLVYQGPVD